MIVPFMAIVFILSYLPLYGWLYAFYDYHPGLKLSQVPFVGFKYFSSMISDRYTLADIMRVLRNTFAMSFLGLLTSPIPLVLAILISKIGNKGIRKSIQTLITVPNFISWILVGAIAYAMFSVGDGFFNRLLIELGVIDHGINFLASSNNVWVTMQAYSLWKNVGWTAIIYFAALASIDTAQYEAATVDGANFFQSTWYITVPGLMPTYFVILVLTIANFVNNGIEQYFVFQNPMNKDTIEVLDLYVYNQGFQSINYSYATAVGILKSFVSMLLLFFANGLSRRVRGQSIF